MRRNLFRSIRKSLGRYIAIMAIIALGAGLFVGLLATKKDMLVTGQRYMDKQNMFDLRLVSPYGWTDKELDAIRQFEEVETAEGSIVLDVIAGMSGQEDASVYQLHRIPDTVNLPLLLGGRMPETANECLVDGHFATDAVLGTEFCVLSENEEDTLDSLNCHRFTVVGYVNSPLFMDMTRGSTTLGNGSITNFIYIPDEAFDVAYYTEIYMTIPGEYTVYSDTYNDALESYSEILEEKLAPLVEARGEELLAEAKEEYEKGLAEYDDGLAEFEDANRKAQRQMEVGRRELLEAQFEIEENEGKLSDAQVLLEDGQQVLSEQAKTLSSAMQELAKAKADAYEQLAAAHAELLTNYKTVTDSMLQIDDAILQIDSGLAQLDSGIEQLETGLSTLQFNIDLMDTMIGVMDTVISTSEEALENAAQNGMLDEEAVAELEKRLADAKQKRQEYVDQKETLSSDLQTYTQQLEDLKKQRDDLALKKKELQDNKLVLQDALNQINAGFLEIQNSQTQAENQFAAAEAKIQSGKYQLETAQAELDRQVKELEKGILELEDGRKQLMDGLVTYYEESFDGTVELSDVMLSLCDGKQQLLKAKELIDEFENAEVIILDRNTNAGYLAVNNNSDIVAGVSRVFPAFFLLVASLVCITTMTRMIEEERTQIGTLKALGYGSGAIIGKYLLYAGSAAVLGCGFGVFVGSVIFPKILWYGYGLILAMTPDVAIVFNIPLCISVVAVYTAVILGVTWYCCRRSLLEVPAELIRPKAPAVGRKVFLEYLPFWKHLSFLNKVMLRNIFRYRQRLLMMLIGIGGCTALLVTGFGLGDSIVDIVSYQFEEVTTHDIQVQFSDKQQVAQQERLIRKYGDVAESIVFANQSSVDVDFKNAVSSVYMITSTDDLASSFSFHSGKEALDLPDPGQALLSTGVAEKMDISVGDSITLRDPDLRELEVTVSGIFDNNVYNYVIVDPQTIVEQWDEEPEYQIAYVDIRDGIDPHTVGARLSESDDVVFVMINQDIADQVGSMLQALNMIVATVIVCAGLLAVIVLYNLTNINITERVREIATIKVLGFHSIESAMYVFKENLLLSGFGTVIGLFGGKLLLDFVMSQIKIDMVWFQARVFGDSLVWSVIITMLMAVLVDFLLYFRLDKINMAEALKSVE